MKEMFAYRKLNLALILLSLLGMIDTLYLTSVHFSQASAFCALVQGCDVVLQSSYSIVFGIPLAMIGLLYYTTLFACATIWFARKDELFLKILLGISWAGLLASIWFVYLQFFVLDALCQYCIASFIITLSIFVIALIERKRSTYVIPDVL
jgi:uncharacterized membrane protein